MSQILRSSLFVSLNIEIAFAIHHAQWGPVKALNDTARVGTPPRKMIVNPKKINKTIFYEECSELIIF